MPNPVKLFCDLKVLVVVNLKPKYHENFIINAGNSD